MVRTTRFTRPVSFRVASRAPRRVEEIIQPVHGLDRSRDASDLEPGFTPNTENFIIHSGFLTPRSGLSVLGESDTSLGDVGLLAVEHQDVDGTRYAVIASAKTIAVMDSASWSTLSYVLRGTGAAADNLSGTSADDMFSASVYDPDRDQNVLILSNGQNTPKVWEPSQTTFSDLSDFISVESVGVVPFALDNRLCFFNCRDSSTSFPTRVRWSERGATSKFSTIGAGFQDLMDMTGIGTGVAVREMDAVLFSSEEVWLMRPRRDNFAFNFDAVSRSLGCPYGKTIVKTPVGVVFMGRNQMVWLLAGTQLHPIGKRVHEHLAETMLDPTRAFALYSTKDESYQLYYPDSADPDRARHAIYFDLSGHVRPPTDPPVTKLNFHNFQFGAGAEVGADLGADIIWDNVDQTWNEIDTLWNNMVKDSTADKNALLVSSAGTAYRIRSEISGDDGSVITAFWDSHALNVGDWTSRKMLSELWLTRSQSNEPNYLTVNSRPESSEDFTASSEHTLSGTGDQLTQYITPQEQASGVHPQFRITVSDGNKPRFSRFRVVLSKAGRGY